jgi:hypothetical protein
MKIGPAVWLLLVMGCGASVEVTPGHDAGGGGAPKPDAGRGFDAEPDAGGGLDAEPDATATQCGAAGAGSVTLATLSAPPLAIASDGTDLFWLDTFAPGTPATLRAIPVAGGTPRVVTTFSLWNAWVGYCDVTYPDGGVDPGGGTDSSCNTFSLAVDNDNVYAIGPMGVVSAPKAGGTASALVTLGLPNDFVIGPAVASGGALFWVQDHVPNDPDVDETATIERLDVQSGGATTLVTEPTSGATNTVLAADADNVYWSTEGSIRATTLTGSATTTVLSSSSLNAGFLAVAGNRLLWVNEEVSGGGCGECPPPPTPQPEMVQSAPVTGGTTTTLITYPFSTDPSVSVLGDSNFAYVIAAPLSVGSGPANGSLQAYPLAGGSPTTLVTGVPFDLVAMDTCSVYFASGSALEKVAKPAH